MLAVFFFTAVRTVVINFYFKDLLIASMSSQKKARGLPRMKEAAGLGEAKISAGMILRLTEMT